MYALLSLTTVRPGSVHEVDESRVSPVHYWSMTPSLRHRLFRKLCSGAHRGKRDLNAIIIFDIRTHKNYVHWSLVKGYYFVCIVRLRRFMM
ncbi:hypothetical protein B0H34DRAFT_94880 [Crassisporium funariophilum]|nr:hypothetical protein B0H34DRAFT_94880 [Crassisporium funariophilum]